MKFASIVLRASAGMAALLAGCAGGVSSSTSASSQALPQVSIVANPSEGAAPLQVQVSVTASETNGTITGTSIDLGDGSPVVSGTSATHAYNAAGAYSIQATATDSVGASATAKTSVTVSAHIAPTVSLAVAPQAGLAPLTVTSTVTANATNSSIATVSIDFGDGSPPASGTSASHIFTASGTYTVRATATDDFGASSSAMQTVVVSSNQPPEVSLQVLPISGMAPLPVTAAVSAKDLDGSITSLSIDFGDGTAAVTGPTGSHTYTIPGTYTVLATATDNWGATVSATQTVTVTENQAPEVSVQANPTSGTAPLPVDVTITASDPDGSIASTSISFGDGTPPVSTTIGSHTYSAAGSFTITGTAVDNLGASTYKAVLVTVSPAPAGKTYYIDPGLNLNSCTTYSVSTRACGSGNDLAYKTPILFSNAVTPGPGDLIYLRGGTYTTQMVITASGSATAPITYSNYGTEVPTFTGAPTNTWYDDGSAPFPWGPVHSDGQTLMLDKASYVIVQGLTINKTRGIAHCHECQHVILQNNTWQENCNGYHSCASPTIQGEESSMGFWGGSYNSLLNNTISGAFDNIMVVESDHNLIRGNTSADGAHTAISVQCSNYTIVKKNVMSSQWEHLAENLDCEGGYTGQPVLYDATHHNFYENNVFSGTPASSNDYAFNAIQWCGQDGVARLNDVYDNLGGGIHIQVYSSECNTVYHNRAYQNTLVSNGCWGLLSPNADTNTDYDVFVDNLLYLNTGGTSNTNCTTTDSTQLIIRSPSTAKSIKNVSASTDPGFTDLSNRIYTLKAGSAAIDYGTWLTTTSSAGSGTVIPVADAAYFRDAFGIAAEQGDLIQLQGQTQTARIVTVDYAANTLTIDTPLSWTTGLGVALAYQGNAPDAGAHEY